MADLDAEVKNSLRAIQTQVDTLAKSQGRLNDQVKQYAQEARNAFHNSGLEHVKKHTEDTGKAMHELGHAVRYLGGPLGEIVHKLTGGAGMEGGLGRLAIAAGAAGLAIEAFGHFIERQTEEVRRAAEMEEVYITAIEKGEQAQLKQAEAGLQQAEARRKLLAAGGQEAVNAAAALTKNLAGVSKAEDVEGGVAAAYARYGAGPRARATVGLAGDLARAGLGFGEAVSGLLGAGGAVERDGVGNKVAARVYAAKTGRVNGNPDDIYASALAASNGDPLVAAARGAGAVNDATRSDEADKAINEGEVAAMHKRAAEAHPVVTALGNLHNLHERQLQVLERMARVQATPAGAILSLFQDIGSVVGLSEGAPLTRLIRSRREFARSDLQAANAAGDKFAPGE